MIATPAPAEAGEGSVATRLVFRVGHAVAEELAPATAPEFGLLDLAGVCHSSTQPQFDAATMLAATGLPLRPFTLHVDHNTRSAPA